MFLPVTSRAVLVTVAVALAASGCEAKKVQAENARLRAELASIQAELATEKTKKDDCERYRKPEDEGRKEREELDRAKDAGK